MMGWRNLAPLFVFLAIGGCAWVQSNLHSVGMIPAKLCSGEQGWHEVRMAIRKGASLLKWDTSGACYYLGLEPDPGEIPPDVIRSTD